MLIVNLKIYLYKKDSMRKWFWRENFVAFVIALVLSLTFVFMINRVDFLKADIINSQEKKVENTTNSDLKLKFENNSFWVLANKDIQNLSTLSFIVVFDPAKTKITKENIDWDNFTVASAWEWKINVILQVNNMKVGDKLLNVKFTWDQSVINVSDAIINFTDGNSEWLSIWS